MPNPMPKRNPMPNPISPGKDVPFQLDFLQRYGVPLFERSLVLAHDL